jgi:hypothetical protein
MEYAPNDEYNNFPLCKRGIEGDIAMQVVAILSEMSARPTMPAGWPKPEFPVVQVNTELTFSLIWNMIRNP